MGGGALCVMTLRRGGQLVGVAPLFTYGYPGEPRRLAMLAAGLSDYEDVLLEPGIAEGGAARILSHIAETRDRWDEGDFRELPATSPLLAARTPSELSIERAPGSPCSVLALPTSVEELTATLSWRFRRRLRTARNRLARAGDSDVVTADRDSLPGLLDVLFRLHSQRWAERGEAGVLADSRLRRFHETVAPAFLRRGWLRLSALRVGGSPVAAVYGFVYRDRVYMYLSGLDPQAAFYSPGVLLLQHVIEQAIRDGAREFDMLRGTEAYKSDWGVERRWNVALQLRHAARDASRARGCGPDPTDG
jgi:CelD/BcsL family acetyltransferase involved in cellulose biosynthesis